MTANQNIGEKNKKSHGSCLTIMSKLRAVTKCNKTYSELSLKLKE